MLYVRRDRGRGPVCWFSTLHATGAPGISCPVGRSDDFPERYHLHALHMAAGSGMSETMGTPGSSPRYRLSADSRTRIRSGTVSTERHTDAGGWHDGNVWSPA